MPRKYSDKHYKKPTKPHVKPRKPKGQRFMVTAKETRLELIKEAAKNRKRNPDDLSINWDAINSTTNKIQPLGGVFQNKTVIKKTSVYAPVSVRRYKRFSKD